MVKTKRILPFYLLLVFGGGVSESNRPELALTSSQTVLKTAPVTGQDAPPGKGEATIKLIFRPKNCQAKRAGF